MASERFLSTLSDDDRTALEARWTARQYGRSEMIIAHEDADRDVYFVLEGHARATAYSERGRTVTYRDMGPGDIFGELAAIDGRTRSASIMALDTVRVASLSDTAFRDIAESRPTFAWALLLHLSTQMRAMTERVYEFSTLVVRKRLIRELLRLADKDGGAKNKAKISDAPIHSDLAAKIGTHREAVSREMSALTKAKLIEKRGRTLVLNDLSMLELISSGED